MKKIERWTNELCITEAKKYTSRKEFSNKSSAYKFCLKNNILDDVCKHMAPKLTQWTTDMLKNEALKYDSRGSFKNQSESAYTCARSRKILDEICSHMELKHSIWTDEDIKNKASKYNSRGDFAKNDKNAYEAARRNGIIDDVCKHMDFKLNTWTKESILKDASKYDSKIEFKKNSPAYQAAQKIGVIEEACKHMTKMPKWSNETLRCVALEYNTRIDFMKENTAAYSAARHLGILDAVCSHMEHSSRGFDRKKPGILYYIKFESETELPLYKIGITNFDDVEVRIRSMGVDKYFTKIILAVIPFHVGAEAYKLEQSLHKEHAEHRYYGDPIMANGNTELFVKDVLGYDTSLAA